MTKMRDGPQVNSRVSVGQVFISAAQEGARAPKPAREGAPARPAKKVPRKARETASPGRGRARLKAVSKGTSAEGA